MSIEDFKSAPFLAKDDVVRSAFVQEYLGQPYIGTDQTGGRATGDANPPGFQTGMWATGDALPNGNQTTLQRVPNNYPQPLG